MNSQIGTILIAGIIGLLLGLLIMWLYLRTNRQQQKQYKTIKTQFTEYQHQVEQHLVGNATAIEELNHSYQKMLTQWNQTVHQLMHQTKLPQIKLPENQISSIHKSKKSTEPSHIEITSPPYTDATQAEVVPIHGQPDQVPDRIDQHTNMNKKS